MSTWDLKAMGMWTWTLEAMKMMDHTSAACHHPLLWLLHLKLM
jgi:hypothetical protein